MVGGGGPENLYLYHKFFWFQTRMKAPLPRDHRVTDFVSGDMMKTPMQILNKNVWMVTTSEDNVNDLNKESLKYVTARSQVYHLNRLLDNNILTDEEKDIVRRGRNSNPHSTAKNADIIEYKYATGLSSALSIASRILRGDKKTRDNYLEFLSSGGNDYPLNILKKVEVDMTTPKPIEEALNMFKEKLEELKELTK